MKRCSSCHAGTLKRCARAGVDEYLASLAGIYPHRCGCCRGRRYAILWTKALPTLLCLLVLLGGVGAVVFGIRLRIAASEGRTMTVKGTRPEIRKTSAGKWAMSDSSTVLDNESVMSLAHTNLSTRTLVKVIERSPCRFDTSPRALIRIKQSGVPDDVIYAMLNNLDQCFSDPGQPAVSSPNVQEKLEAAINRSLAAPLQ